MKHSTIQDIVEAVPRPRDIFDQVKKRLIDTYGSSAETRLRQLIKGQVSTIGKPSLILNRLRGLKTGANDDVIRTVFLDQLTPICRATLAISEVTDLQKLAQMADKVTEASEPNFIQVSAVGAPDTISVASITSQLTQIMERLTKLEKGQKDRRGRNRSNSRNEKSRGKSRDSTTAGTLFRIHKEFGKDARHCHPPCNWAENQKPEN